jgi:hypothetical protein
MTKIKQSDFTGDNVTTLEKPKTKAQKLVAFRKKNHAAYQKACDSHCMCSPSKAELLLMAQYQGDAEID